jgi:hypothetical protein
LVDRQSPQPFGQISRGGGGISLIGDSSRKTPLNFSSQNRESAISPNGFSRCDSPTIEVVEKGNNSLVKSQKEIYLTDLKLPSKEGPSSRPTNLFQPYLDVEKNKSTFC